MSATGGLEGLSSHPSIFYHLSGARSWGSSFPSWVTWWFTRITLKLTRGQAFYHICGHMSWILRQRDELRCQLISGGELGQVLGNSAQAWCAHRVWKRSWSIRYSIPVSRKSSTAFRGTLGKSSLNALTFYTLLRWLHRVASARWLIPAVLVMHKPDNGHWRWMEPKTWKSPTGLS